MADTYAYIYQLQNQSYTKLSSTNFKIAVTDPDDTHLTSSQVRALTDSGKTMLSYLSIGEAEDYRSYWQSSWDSNPPSFIINENPDWPGNYRVKFWDASWQNLIIGKAVDMAKAGYSGIVLDVVDVYNESAVSNAYSGDARKAMMDFVIKISDAVHAVNADFKIIQNNAHDLVTTNGEPSGTLNSNYLSHIDGINAETTWYLPDNSKPSWGPWNLDYLERFHDAGMDVFTIDYPSGSSQQGDYINKSVAEGFIPYVGNQALSTIPASNSTILSKLSPSTLEAFIGESSGGGSSPLPGNLNGTNYSDTINGTSANETLNGLKGSDILNGGAGNDSIYGGDGGDKLYGGTGNDHLYGGNGNDKFYIEKSTGNDIIHDFQGAGATGGDVLYVSKSIYTTKAQVLSHISYNGSDATLQLDGVNKVTLLGVDHVASSDIVLV